jgi:Ala-tRNA(Pro) deacylase
VKTRISGGEAKMAISEKLMDLLEREGVKFEHLTHPEVYTTQEVAAVEHERGRCVIKVVVVKADGSFVLAGVAAALKVDPEALGKLLGAKEVVIAEEHEFAGLFPDSEVGAMPPFGNLYGLPLWLDKGLIACEEVAFNAGTHADTIKMSFADFERLASPEVGEFAVMG